MKTAKLKVTGNENAKVGFCAHLREK